MGASLAALTWARPGPAARWLTGEALAEVSVRLEGDDGPPGRRPRPAPRRLPRARGAGPPRGRPSASWNRPPRSASSACTPPSSTTRSSAPAAPSPRPSASSPGARAAILRTVLEGAGVPDLPPGWGAPSHATSARRRPHRPARGRRRPDRPSSTPRCWPRRAWSRPESSARPSEPPPRANPSPWTASPTSSPWNSGYAASSPAEAPAGPAPRHANAPYRRASPPREAPWARATRHSARQTAGSGAQGQVRPDPAGAGRSDGPASRSRGSVSRRARALRRGACAVGRGLLQGRTWSDGPWALGSRVGSGSWPSRACVRDGRASPGCGDLCPGRAPPSRVAGSVS